jgi:hypothetical protein
MAARVKITISSLLAASALGASLVSVAPNVPAVANVITTISPNRADNLCNGGYNDKYSKAVIYARDKNNKLTVVHAGNFIPCHTKKIRTITGYTGYAYWPDTDGPHLTDNYRKVGLLKHHWRIVKN